MPGPLAGLRVVDWTTGTAGPRAAGLLADYGADVVRVEPPGGDPHRQRLAVEYAVFNRGKRLVELDLGDEVGRADLRALLSRADVFLHSWRPGVAERFGLGYAELHDELPGLVHGVISAVGPDDRLADLRGYESLIHAVVGTMGEQFGFREGPIYEGLPFASIGAANLAVIGVLAALHRREDDGLGRQVETSLLDGALSFLAMLWRDDDRGTAPHMPGGRRLLVRSVECADGAYLGVHTGAVGAFDRLMERLGLAEHFVLEPGQLSMAVELTPEQQHIMEHDVLDAFRSRTRDEWEQELLVADVCAVPELRPGEVFDRPQPRHNAMVLRIDDPELGPVDQVAPPARFAATPHRDPGPTPHRGEHDGRLAELLAGAPWRDPVIAPSAPPSDEPLLAGVKVLDLGAFFAGPYGPRLLADLGADVVKLEPLGGDQLRGLARPFGSAQRGKRGVALDLKHPQAREIGRRLVGWADVVSHNMRPGAAERVGFGYEQVRADNPGVVYVYAPGWGSTGPDALRQSFAPLLSGYVGANYEVAGQFNAPLYPSGNEDPGAGLLGAAATLMALLHRRRTGHGQYVETPQLNAAMTHLAHVVRRPDGTVLGADRLDTLQLGVGAFDRLYETSDGWVVVAAHTDDEVAGLAKVAGLDLPGPDAAAGDDYATAQQVAAVLGRLTTEAARAALAGAGVPVAVPVPRNDATFLRDPVNQANHRVAEYPDPEAGRVRELAHFVRVSGAALPLHQPFPGLGEHTDEVLAMVGCTADEIAALRAAGVAR